LRQRKSDTRPYTERTLTVITRLERFTQKAREEPQTRFNALMGILFDPEGRRESFERQDGSKAPGIDGVRKEDYAEGVEARLEDLSERIRRLGYIPQPVRRAYIPKGDGRYRPLGVPMLVSYCTSLQMTLGMMEPGQLRWPEMSIPPLG